MVTVEQRGVAPDSSGQHMISTHPAQGRVAFGLDYMEGENS